jgi:hypothetical protein
MIDNPPVSPFKKGGLRGIFILPFVLAPSLHAEPRLAAREGAKRSLA